MLCLGWLFSNIISAQSTYQLGVLPSINLNYKLRNDWSANFKIESRQLLQRGTFNSDVDKSYQYVLTDYSWIVARKIGLNARLSGGYLFRFREGQATHRLIQQYTIIQRLPSLRLAHRIVTDQTFSDSDDTEYRLRYRLATEIPLNGQSADPKEFYIKISNEYLNSLQSAEYDLEIRVVPLLGYAVTDKQKVEFGLDYRVNSFLDKNARHSFWISLNWFFEM
ncbi:MAG TPA: DUF2490 domain-containing protein [Saprospiraceae bacterium]|nr:DUF2490 domain-containing protein [Saprospiraceae bacterium]HMQ82869.1 DUF2490 domain-containing protein [Saprospiraceae bacterium]